MFGGGGLMGLVMNSQVRDLLNLSDAQIGQLTVLQEKMREEMGERFAGMRGFRDLSETEREARMRELQEEAQKRNKETEEKLAEILTKEQFKKAKQIELQQQGVRALLRDDIIQALSITEEQQKELQDIAEEVGAKRRELFMGMRDMTDEEREGIRDKMQGFQRDLERRSMAVLTDEQKTTLKNIMGEPVELDLSQMRGPGRGGFGGGGRQRGGGDQGNRNNRPRRPSS
jgi:hypothetical protein